MFAVTPPRVRLVPALDGVAVEDQRLRCLGRADWGFAVGLFDGVLAILAVLAALVVCHVIGSWLG